MTLSNLLRLFADCRCTRLYGKALAENDNSKNQIYLAGDLEALNILPSQKIYAQNTKSGPSFKARLDFSWLHPSGRLFPAPGAQFILYAQYPEVRFSGFLQGAEEAPSELLAKRLPGRILFFGVTRDSKIIGFAVGSDTKIAKEYREIYSRSERGVLVEIPLSKQSEPCGDSRLVLLRELGRIHRKGWIDSKQLSENGEVLPCTAQQCGGFTLEAELKIPKNSKAEPDFLGWEVKQYAVPSFLRSGNGRITLMTPEPDGGFYKTLGIEGFIRRFGYKDKMGRPDRMNFGGIHKVNEASSATGLTMKLIGYEKDKNKIKNADGALVLETREGKPAASWSFSSILEHWTKKHAKAVYVPSTCRKEPKWQYSYGKSVQLCEKTDALKLLYALAKGDVFYDPGIKMENASSSKPLTKRRSQFRISTGKIGSLYHKTEVVEV